MVKESGIQLPQIELEAPDLPFGLGSGAGTIYGTTGGVAEAVVRFCLPDKSKNALRELEFSPLRGDRSIRVAVIKVGDREVHLAIVHGLSNAQRLLKEIEAGSAYFATARLNRQQARDSALSLLQDAAAREDADEAVKTQLNDNIQTMADYTVTEAQIENLVVAKGYTDCVAFIGEDALSLAVSAPEGGLTEADTAKILDVVKQTAGYTADQVTIIEVE